MGAATARKGSSSRCGLVSAVVTQLASSGGGSRPGPGVMMVSAARTAVPQASQRPSHVAYGGADFGEVAAITGQITEGDYDSWHDAWLAAAERLPSMVSIQGRHRWRRRSTSRTPAASETKCLTRTPGKGWP